MKWLFCKANLHRWSWEFLRDKRDEWPDEWVLICLECGKVFNHDQ